jgi:V8-like Glu-specific endopeptidase
LRIRREDVLCKGDRLNIIQHPRGTSKRIAIRSNFFVDRLNTAEEPSRIRYLTDTEPGASGSPVLDDNWQVLGLHHAAIPVPESQYRGRTIKYNNQGIAVSAILADLEPVLRREIAVAQGWPQE